MKLVCNVATQYMGYVTVGCVIPRGNVATVTVGCVIPRGNVATVTVGCVISRGNVATVHGLCDSGLCHIAWQCCNSTWVM